ncbi:MAG TPA: copper resistance CopC family protein [Methylomirabilota bacterium]|nr:copper resistance CopC family protein [Methylomirabilota bacterium]
MTRARAALAAGAFLLAAAVPAAAHSLLLESTPAAGASVAAPPPRVLLRFNNRIEKPLSRLRLLDERGGERPLVISASDDPADRLSAAMPPLSPGTYRVEWQVLSTDGHIVVGSFTFRLVP